MATTNKPAPKKPAPKVTTKRGSNKAATAPAKPKADKIDPPASEKINALNLECTSLENCNIINKIANYDDRTFKRLEAFENEQYSSVVDQVKDLPKDLGYIDPDTILRGDWLAALILGELHFEEAITSYEDERWLNFQKAVLFRHQARLEQASLLPHITRDDIVEGAHRQDEMECNGQVLPLKPSKTLLGYETWNHLTARCLDEIYQQHSKKEQGRIKAFGDEVVRKAQRQDLEPVEVLFHFFAKDYRLVGSAGRMGMSFLMLITHIADERFNEFLADLKVGSLVKVDVNNETAIETVYEIHIPNKDVKITTLHRQDEVSRPETTETFQTHLGYETGNGAAARFLDSFYEHASEKERARMKAFSDVVFLKAQEKGLDAVSVLFAIFATDAKLRDSQGLLTGRFHDLFTKLNDEQFAEFVTDTKSGALGDVTVNDAYLYELTIPSKNMRLVAYASAGPFPIVTKENAMNTLSNDLGERANTITVLKGAAHHSILTSALKTLAEEEGLVDNCKYDPAGRAPAMYCYSAVVTSHNADGDMQMHGVLLDRPVAYNVIRFDGDKLVVEILGEEKNFIDTSKISLDAAIEVHNADVAKTKLPLITGSHLIGEA